MWSWLSVHNIYPMLCDMMVTGQQWELLKLKTTLWDLGPAMEIGE